MSFERIAQQRKGFGRFRQRTGIGPTATFDRQLSTGSVNVDELRLGELVDEVAEAGGAKPTLVEGRIQLHHRALEQAQLSLDAAPFESL